MQQDLRAFPRYFLPNGLAAMIGKWDASVVDLSVKGARLQTTEQLVAGTQLGFAMMAAGSTIRTTATVLWCQMAALALDAEESDVFLAGVVFEEALPALGTVIDRMIALDEAMRIQDSRSTERYSVTAYLKASFGDHCLDARILDLSLRGARLAMRQPVRVGTEACLRFSPDFGPTVEVETAVRWCRKSDRNAAYEIGIHIPHEESLMGAVLAQMCMRKQARVDLNSLRRKFDPLRTASMTGMVALAS